MILEAYYETWVSRPIQKRAKGRATYSKPQWEHTSDTEEEAIAHNKMLSAYYPDWKIEIRAVEQKREYWDVKTAAVRD